MNILITYSAHNRILFFLACRNGQSSTVTSLIHGGVSLVVQNKDGLSASMLGLMIYGF